MRFPDQRSSTEQLKDVMTLASQQGVHKLKDLITLANREGMYDAADVLRDRLERCKSPES